ncbi:uncharacterized protein itprid1 [Toxotes jaculatrix]|uniref:uncharacterized protein itprid1 n=1 Tax=Toxotes jaculatrix TaxID=941984 RepID=UPI001B3AAEA6|nr:uncharacterized protein itprid1 [Toxotes jaculatrix]
METPLDQDQSPPASLSELVFEYHPSCSFSQSVAHSQSPMTSQASFMCLSPTSSPMQAASLTRGAENIKTQDKDAPSPHLSTLLHDSKGTASSTCSRIPQPPSPSLNLDCPFSTPTAMSSTQSDSSSGGQGNTQSEWAEVTLHENSLSFPHPSSSSAQESNQNDLVFSDSDRISFSETPTYTQNEKDETPSSLSFQLNKDNFSAPFLLVLDFYKVEEGCSTLPCLSSNASIPVCQSVLSSKSHDPDISDLTDQSISKQGQPYFHDDNTDPIPASPVQDVFHVKMDHLSLDIEDTLQGNGKREGERHTDTVQTQESVVYISDTESSAGLSESSRLASEEVCNQTEIDPQISSCSLHDEHSTETKQEELRKVCQVEINGTGSESARFYLAQKVPEVHSRIEVEQKDLIEIESLDLVFETSVDGSEGENGDDDTFFKQLDTECQVYWAEPIQVSNPTSVFKESGSLEATNGFLEHSLLLRSSAALDSVSSTGKDLPLSLSSSSTMGTDQNSGNATASSDSPCSLALAPFLSLPATPDLKLSSRSVSVQMSSSPPSHIVHRKDVPYMAESKCTLFSSVLPLDTSTPFRAVQAWTDGQIQRNALINTLSHGALHTVPNEVSISVGSETTHRPTLIFSSSPSVPLLSNGWQSHDCLPGMTENYRTVSSSVDTALWPEKKDKVDRNGNKDEEKLWEGSQTATMVCCCSCDHQCTCCIQNSYNKQHILGNTPYSLGDLGEMMLSLQKFCSVLSNMEEQLSEGQAAVYSALSDPDREKVRDIEELRRAVKQEAGELEMQLNELAHHYDDSLNMKMHRLLDEQSLLCSQLRVFLPGAVPTSLSPTHNRTVATQCCLLPWFASADVEE